MNILFALLIAVIAFCSYLLLDAIMIQQRRQQSLRSRIAPDGSAEQIDMSDETLHVGREPSARGRMLLGILRSLGVNTEQAIVKLDQRFAQAGIVSGDAPVYYLFFERIVSVLVCSFALMLLISHRGQDNALMFQITALIIVILAVFGPYLYLKNKSDHRKKALQRAFPDTLDLLLICVEAGLALDAALNRICGELSRAYPAMAGELNRTRLELSLLNDRVKALNNLAERTDMTAFRSLVASLIQSERFGTSLTDTLRVLAEDFRLQRLTGAEAKAARIPVLMTIPLMIFLLPAFMIIVLGPAMVSVAHLMK